MGVSDGRPWSGSRAITLPNVSVSIRAPLDSRAAMTVSATASSNPDGPGRSTSFSSVERINSWSAGAAWPAVQGCSVIGDGHEHPEGVFEYSARVPADQELILSTLEKLVD